MASNAVAALFRTRIVLWILAGSVVWENGCCGEFNSLYEALTGRRLAGLPGVERLGLGLGGWASLGVTYNSRNPGDHMNGPVTFNDRASEPQLNQLYLYLERVVNKEAKRWDVGGRLDVVWGTDSRFVHAAGNWDEDLIREEDLRFYDLAFSQAYLEIATPWVRGATAKLGHFYTILGQEVVQSPNNFFYSHSYAMQYGEPFTHTGVLVSYPLRESISLLVGVVTAPYLGYDNFDRRLSNWNFLGGLTWVGDSGETSISAALTSGPVSMPGDPNRTIASLVFNHAVTGELQYILQMDHGSQTRLGQEDANWYGVNQYLIYALTDSVSLGLRGEWFRDDDGARVTAAPASYYELTTGLNWKPEGWLQLRLEGRNDWVDGARPAFGSSTRNRQFTLGASATVLF